MRQTLAARALLLGKSGALGLIESAIGRIDTHIRPPREKHEQESPNCKVYQSAWHHHYRSSGAGPPLRGEEMASKRADHDAAIRQIGSFSKVAIIVHLPLNGHLGHRVLNKMPTRVRLFSNRLDVLVVIRQVSFVLLVFRCLLLFTAPSIAFPSSSLPFAVGQLSTLQALATFAFLFQTKNASLLVNARVHTARVRQCSN